MIKALGSTDQCKSTPPNQLPFSASKRVIRALALLWNLPTRGLQTQPEKKFSLPVKPFPTRVEDLLWGAGKRLFWDCLKGILAMCQDLLQDIKGKDQRKGKRGIGVDWGWRSMGKRCKSSLVGACIRKPFNTDFWFDIQIYRQEYEAMDFNVRLEIPSKRVY